MAFDEEPAMELLRASIFHTPRNPFHSSGPLEFFADGGLFIRDGRIEACGDYTAIRNAYPDVEVTDLRGGFLLPGFIDTHIHFPQGRIIGSLGRSLLDWLEHCALPEEARMDDDSYATLVAAEFMQGLVTHGTTTALVFGAHFPRATAILFEAAQARGLRIISGQVFSDRLLSPALHQSAESAYRDGSDLIRRFHGQGRLLYAVTPRFALSASEAMLEVCQTLMNENMGVRFQTHLNENDAEIAEVRRQFPWARDYLAVYERYGLGGRGAVMAHNVHPSNSELERLAAGGTSVAHCPCSNAALGSGIFPLAGHLKAKVHFALGSDVGGGTGYGMLKEGLQAYLLQRLTPGGAMLTGEQLLYLATKAGAEALDLADETGDFMPGKSADLVYLKAPERSPLAAVLKRAPDAESILAAIFTLAGAECVEEVRVAGEVVHRTSPDRD